MASVPAATSARTKLFMLRNIVHLSCVVLRPTATAPCCQPGRCVEATLSVRQCSNAVTLATGSFLRCAPRRLYTHEIALVRLLARRSPQHQLHRDTTWSSRRNPPLPKEDF